tara:strand:+ start:753 stop:965 length:213 start_codon:yes stop_codon:yes gene_type:complete
MNPVPLLFRHDNHTSIDGIREEDPLQLNWIARMTSEKLLRQHSNPPNSKKTVHQTTNPNSKKSKTAKKKN